MPRWFTQEAAALLLRRFITESRLLGLILACLTGAAGGLIASYMGLAAMALHWWFFGVPFTQRLSGDFVPDLGMVAICLVTGGFLVGISNRIWRLYVKLDIADPIEANALYGGRMTFRGSLFVAGQAIASNGVGASVGLEGGFTQLASAIGSWLGRVLKRPREDMRLLVACGAAGAISGAFDAPFAGLAYGFELVLAAYSPLVLAPVALAAICGKYAAAFSAGHGYHIAINSGLVGANAAPAGLWSLGIGIACGILAIGLMRGVTWLEHLIQLTRLPRFIATTLGGAAMAGVALISSHVLGAGHGAIDVTFAEPQTAPVLAGLLVLKIAACVISIGCGFRGGLFSASLYLGALAGGAAGLLVTGAGFMQPEALAMMMVIAMAAFGAAVVGTPLAMAILAAEMTGQIGIIPDALLAVIAATLVVRALFGYSFSIWRLHVRGSPARSAEDIAWARTIQMKEIMRPDVHKAPDTISCAELLSFYPPGSTKRVVLTDAAGRYRGVCDPSEVAFSARDTSAPAENFAKQKDEFLTLAQSLDDALHWLEKLGRESVIVVRSESDPQVMGVVTESYVLKRYAQELERRKVA